MKQEPVWISAELAVAIHEQLLEEHGGGSGIRDTGSLQFALAAPRNRWAYGERDLVSLAVCYAHAVNRNHPFMDGNKRVAFMLAAVFLEVNGSRITASETEVVTNSLALAAGELSEQEFADWLKHNCTKQK